jgi:hypothetical protein
MKRMGLVTGLVLLAAVSYVVSSLSIQYEQLPRSTVQFEHEQQIGLVETDTTRSFDLTIRNNSDHARHIQSCRLLSDRLFVGPYLNIVNPGETIALPAVLDATGLSGNVRGKAIITWDDNDRDGIAFHVKALREAPTVVDGGSVAAGGQAASFIPITSLKASDVEVTESHILSCELNDKPISSLAEVARSRHGDVVGVLVNMHPPPDCPSGQVELRVEIQATGTLRASHVVHVLFNILDRVMSNPPGFSLGLIKTSQANQPSAWFAQLTSPYGSLFNVASISLDEPSQFLSIAVENSTPELLESTTIKLSLQPHALQHRIILSDSVIVTGILADKSRVDTRIPIYGVLEP